MTLQSMFGGASDGAGGASRLSSATCGSAFGALAQAATLAKQITMLRARIRNTSCSRHWRPVYS
jgi:hypothetical protein